MKTVLIILGVILSPAILYFLAFILGLLDMKVQSIIPMLYSMSDIEMMEDSSVERTRYSHRITVARHLLLGVVVLLFTTISVIGFVVDGPRAGIVLAIFGAVLTLLPLYLCLQTRLSYEIIGPSRIYVSRVFGRRRILYDEMAYYRQNESWLGDVCEIVVYGADGKRLLWVHGRVGIQALINALEAHGVRKEA